MFEHSSHHFVNFTHRSDLFGRGGGGEVVGGAPSGINDSLVLGGKGGGDSLEHTILSGIDLSTSIGREPTE